MDALPLFTQAINSTSLPSAAIEGLYVHIPFCFHKCHYCDFYSIVRQSAQRIEQFVNRILIEAQLWANARGSSIKPQTVFFGGGTPTLVPLESMHRLIEGLRSRLDLSAVTEWTIEANPATVTPDYCRMLAETGVTRMSFGAQSFDRQELSILERHHNPDDVPRSLEMARAGGIHRLNVDLIYAIPNQTLAQWMHSLETALQLGTDHLSCYGLTFEPNTPIAVRRRLGQLNSIEPELELEMMRATRRRLAGISMPSYEISNYARAGQECRHNLLYWTGGNYLGLGPSAASHIEGCRWRNRPHLGEWESAIDRHALASIDVETLSPIQRAGELMMLMLRLSRGVKYSDYSARIGCDARELYAEPIERLARLGLIKVDGIGIRLSEQGISVADAVAAEFLSTQADAAATPSL